MEEFAFVPEMILVFHKSGMIIVNVYERTVLFPYIFQMHYLVSGDVAINTCSSGMMG